MSSVQSTGSKLYSEKTARLKDACSEGTIKGRAAGELLYLVQQRAVASTLPATCYMHRLSSEALGLCQNP